MTIKESFGEAALTKDNLLDTLNRVWLPLLKKMRQAQNDCECEGGGGGHATTFSLTEPTDGDDGDVWVETA